MMKMYSMRGRNLYNFLLLTLPVMRYNCSDGSETLKIKLIEKIRMYRYAGRLFNRKLFPH